MNCPAGSAVDPSRLESVLAPLDADAGPACFGPGLEMGVRPDGTLLLDSDWPDPALSARVAHLRLHEPLRPGPGCLEEAIQQEAVARVEEQRLRGVLGVAGPPLGWPELSSAPELAAWLRENPDRAVDGYRIRCED